MSVTDNPHWLENGLPRLCLNNEDCEPSANQHFIPADKAESAVWNYVGKPLRSHVFAGKNERKAFSTFSWKKVFGHHVQADVRESRFLSSQPLRNTAGQMQTVNRTRLSSYAEQQNRRSLGSCPPDSLQPQFWTL